MSNDKVRVLPWKTIEDIPLFLTPNEVAILWNVNPRTILRRLNDGRLFGVKPDDKNWRIYRDEALKHLGLDIDSNKTNKQKLLIDTNET